LFFGCDSTPLVSGLGVLSAYGRHTEQSLRFRDCPARAGYHQVGSCKEFDGSLILSYYDILERNFYMLQHIACIPRQRKTCHTRLRKHHILLHIRCSTPLHVHFLLTSSTVVKSSQFSQRYKQKSNGCFWSCPTMESNESFIST
jgi:hypothetical protein